MPPCDRDKRDFRLGNWLVQPGLGRISNASGEVQLEPRAMELLVFLADHSGHVVSRQQLLDGVWRQEFVSDATVSGTIAKLRRALGDDARSPRYIETLSKRGYRLLLRPVDVLEVASRPGGAFRVGDWLVEPSLNRMSQGDVRVELERSTMDVLLCLAERAGEPVLKDELVDRVWRTESVSDFTVGRRIAELKEALGDGARNPGYIETVPEGGYRLAAAVALTEPHATVTPFPAARPEPDRDPYPGLAAFTADDAGVFFGREAETAAMWRRISSRRLLAVIGPSGVGKSSFIRAGVIPAAPPGWRALICAPGEAPFMALARALVPELAGDAEQVEQLLGFDDPEVALAVLSRWRGRWDEGLLVIDQLEELFTLNPPETRARFVDLLLRLVTAARVHVVLVMRDDFLCELQAHPPLAPIFKDLTVLGPPNTGDLRRALVEPARRRGFRFDDDELPDEMVASLADERGALPLLAFAARRLWELRDTEKRLITREAYDSIGGVAGALAHHAQATLDEIGPERLPMVRELFRNLVTARATRATRSVDDLLSVFTLGDRSTAAEVLQKLVDARLLTSFEETSTEEFETEGQRRVEIVHESLLREWPRLVRWQTQDADAARLRDQLRQAAQLWHTRGRPAELLWTGPPYLEFRAWRQSYPGGLTSAEQSFAEAMISHAGRRRRRRRLITAAVLVAALVVAVVTSVLWRRSEHDARRLEAWRLYQTAQQRMERSPPKALAYALASLELMDGVAERRLALRAAQSSPMPLVVDFVDEPALAVGVEFSPDGGWLTEGKADGHLALWPSSGAPPVVWQAHEGTTRGRFAPDSKTLLSFSPSDSQLHLWSVPEARHLGSLTRSSTLRTEVSARWANTVMRLWRLLPDPSAPGGWINDRRAEQLCERLAAGRLLAAALSPDGSKLVYALGEELYLAGVAGPVASTSLGRCRSAVDFVAYHPDGDRLATSHTDGSIQLWALRDGVAETLREWPCVSNEICGGSCVDLRFDPSGTVLAAAFDAGAAIVRGVDDPPGSDPLVLSLSGGRLIELAFHPEGSWLATATLSWVSLWPLERTRYPFVLRGHSAKVERVAFHPDGTCLLSYSKDGTVRRWPLSAAAGATSQILYDWGHPVESYIGWMAVSPDGSYLVTTGGEESARLVPLDGSAAKTLGGFEQRPLRAAVGGQGRLVAIPGQAPAGRVVRVWDLEADAVTEIGLGDEDSSLWSSNVFVEIVPDGRLLVADRGQLVSIELATGQRTPLAEGVGMFSQSRDGTLILSRRSWGTPTSVATVHDLDENVATPLTRHGDGVTCLALDASGTIAVTGSIDGSVRVGPVTGEAPQWLVGHEGTVRSVAVSPDGRWIASGGADGTIRLWPMPDLSKPPLHDLPRAQLIARLKSLTNLRVVRNPDDPDDYVVKAGPFPGWKTTPEW